MLKIVSRLFFLSTLFLVISCAPKKVELPDYEGIDVREVLTAQNSVSSIETIFSVVFEKEDSEMRGEGRLNILKSGDLKMRVYSFGFLAFEMSSENGIVRSNPLIDRSKGVMLTEGLRDCLFWWDMKDFEIRQKEDVYVLKNLSRSLTLDRKTMFPLQQTVALHDGRELTIHYAGHEKVGERWYPSKIRIELSRYAVTMKIKEISFLPGV
jgi:outer membrane lipoprotein-sorting protein